MARCWTCGSATEYACYRCSVCEVALAVPRVEEQLSAIRHGLSDVGDTIASSITDASHTLTQVLSSGFDDIASILEWGVEELSWQIQQATVLLRSIDERLRTPVQTRARELREMGETLAARGDQEKAKAFFRRSLDESPLDYRAYVSLAFCQTKANDLSGARDTLAGSLLHAPKTEKLDYRSYSYRLIAHTYACESNSYECLRNLSSALELSPEYPEALFDLAQAVASSSDDVITAGCSGLFRSWGHNWRVAVENIDYDLVCSLSLVKAIKANPVFYYIAAKDRRFDGRRTLVDEALNNHRSNTLGPVESDVYRMTQDLEEVDGRLRRLKGSLMYRLAITFSGQARRYDLQLEQIVAELHKAAALSGLRSKMESGDYIHALQARKEGERNRKRVTELKESFYTRLQSKSYWMFSSPT